MEWWFRDRYRLPPTDPRYLDMTREAMLLEYWTAYYADLARNGASTFEAEDEEFDLTELLRDAEGEDWDTLIEEGP